MIGDRPRPGAPGTAVALRNALQQGDSSREFPITSIRGGFDPGTHGVIYDAPFETVRLEHQARSRQVFAAGALMAGEWGEQDRHDMTAAYIVGSGLRTTVEELSEAAQYAHIQIAVQWLGWFGRRRAPDIQTRDWLGDAIERAEALNL